MNDKDKSIDEILTDLAKVTSKQNRNIDPEQQVTQQEESQPPKNKQEHTNISHPKRNLVRGFLTAAAMITVGITIGGLPSAYLINRHKAQEQTIPAITTQETQQYPIINLPAPKPIAEPTVDTAIQKQITTELETGNHINETTSTIEYDELKKEPQIIPEPNTKTKAELELVEPELPEEIRQPVIESVQETIDEPVQTLIIDPDHIPLQEAIHLIESRQFDVARDRLEDIVKNNPDNSLAHLTLGRIYRSLSDFEKALEHHKIAAELNPDEAESHAELALSLMNTYHTDLARASVRRALDLDNDEATAQYVDARLDLREDKYDSTKKKAERLIETHPSYFRGHRLLARLGIALKDHDSAEQHILKALELNPYDAISHCLLGWVYKYTERFGLAEKEAQKAIQLNSKEPLSLNLQGALYFDQEDFIKAAKYFETAIKYDSRTADIQANLAFAYLKRRRFEDAEKQLAVVESLDTEFPRLPNIRGLLYFNTNRVPQALTEFDKAIKYAEKRNDPNISTFISNKGMTLNWFGKTEEAKTLLEEALKIDPNNQLARDEMDEIILIEQNNRGELGTGMHQIGNAMIYSVDSRDVSIPSGLLEDISQEMQDATKACTVSDYESLISNHREIKNLIRKTLPYANKGAKEKEAYNFLVQGQEGLEGVLVDEATRRGKGIEEEIAVITQQIAQEQQAGTLTRKKRREYNRMIESYENQFKKDLLLKEYYQPTD